METLLAWAQERGYRVAWGPKQVADDARKAIRDRHAAGEFDEAVFQSEYADLAAEAELPGWATPLLVAVPRPAHSVRFERAEPDRPVVATLPPTYLHYTTVFEEVRRDLAGHGLPGFRVEHLGGPIKTMAAALGLVRYGRNNIAYADGLGTYIQLCPFVTDAPLAPRELPVGPSLLPECDDCNRCERACPTNAIVADRVLLHAERCLTLATESAGPWLDFAVGQRLTCLSGCLLCQRSCPVNPPLRVEDSGLAFSVEETQALLDHPDDLPESVAQGISVKLAWLEAPGLRGTLGRNLGALVAGRIPAPAAAVSGDERGTPG